MHKGARAAFSAGTNAFSTVRCVLTVFLHQTPSLSCLGGFREQNPLAARKLETTSVCATGEVFELISPGNPFTAHLVPGIILLKVLSQGCRFFPVDSG